MSVIGVRFNWHALPQAASCDRRHAPRNQRGRAGQSWRICPANEISVSASRNRARSHRGGKDRSRQRGASLTVLTGSPSQELPPPPPRSGRLPVLVALLLLLGW